MFELIVKHLPHGNIQLFWSDQGSASGEGVWPVPETQETKALPALGECSQSFHFTQAFHLPALYVNLLVVFLCKITHCVLCMVPIVM